MDHYDPTVDGVDQFQMAAATPLLHDDPTLQDMHQYALPAPGGAAPPAPAAAPAPAGVAAVPDQDALAHPIDMGNIKDSLVSDGGIDATTRMRLSRMTGEDRAADALALVRMQHPDAIPTTNGDFVWRDQQDAGKFHYAKGKDQGLNWGDVASMFPDLAQFEGAAAGLGPGAAAGAAIGSIIPGPGTAIGGLIGGLAGAGLGYAGVGTGLDLLNTATGAPDTRSLGQVMGDTGWSALEGSAFEGAGKAAKAGLGYAMPIVANKLISPAGRALYSAADRFDAANGTNLKGMLSLAQTGTNYIRGKLGASDGSAAASPVLRNHNQGVAQEINKGVDTAVSGGSTLDGVAHAPANMPRDSGELGDMIAGAATRTEAGIQPVRREFDAVRNELPQGGDTRGVVSTPRDITTRVQDGQVPGVTYPRMLADKSFFDADAARVYDAEMQKFNETIAALRKSGQPQDVIDRALLEQHPTYTGDAIVNRHRFELDYHEPRTPGREEFTASPVNTGSYDQIQAMAGDGFKQGISREEVLAREAYNNNLRAEQARLINENKPELLPRFQAARSAYADYMRPPSNNYPAGAGWRVGEIKDAMLNGTMDRVTGGLERPKPGSVGNLQDLYPILSDEERRGASGYLFRRQGVPPGGAAGQNGFNAQTFFDNYGNPTRRMDGSYAREMAANLYGPGGLDRLAPVLDDGQALAGSVRDFGKMLVPSGTPRAEGAFGNMIASAMAAAHAASNPVKGAAAAVGVFGRDALDNAIAKGLTSPGLSQWAERNAQPYDLARLIGPYTDAAAASNEGMAHLGRAAGAFTKGQMGSAVRSTGRAAGAFGRGANASFGRTNTERAFTAGHRALGVEFDNRDRQR